MSSETGPDDLLDRASYRARPWNQRDGDPRHADPIGTVLGDPPAVAQLAADLSGRYGPFAPLFRGDHPGNRMCLRGSIHDGDGSKVGVIERHFTRCVETGEIVVHHILQELIRSARGKGFGKALWGAMAQYYRRSGAARVELVAALDDGSRVWAKAGYQWDRSPKRLEASLESIREAVEEVLHSDLGLTAEEENLLRALIDSLHPAVDELPSPARILHLGTANMPTLGEIVMSKANWFGVLYL